MTTKRPVAGDESYAPPPECDPAPPPEPTPEPTQGPPIQLYPAWRWTAGGLSRIVADAADDAQAASEGYTLHAPPDTPPPFIGG